MSEFSTRRIRAYKQVIKNFPDGITRDNLQEFRAQLKKEERKLRKADASALRKEE